MIRYCRTTKFKLWFFASKKLLATNGQILARASNYTLFILTNAFTDSHKINKTDTYINSVMN